MSKSQIIASAYFASDDVIFAIRDDGSTSGFKIGRLESAQRDPGPTSMADDLQTALDGIFNLMEDGQELRAVILICPGPFRTIDKKDDDLYGLISWNAEVKNWRDKNAKTMFQKLLIEKLGANEGRKPIIYIYNQAGATAVGEFMHMYGEHIYGARDTGALLKTLGSHLFVVADASIDAALITDGEPYHGLSTMNVGHHAVFPVDEDPEELSRLRCPAHPKRPCLNSLASLDAIKIRWAGMRFLQFQACTDEKRLSLIAFYIAQMLANVSLTTTPAKIVIGGRIAANTRIIPLIRTHFKKLLQDHEHPEIYPGYQQIQDMDQFILGQDDTDAGVKGGLHVLARILIKDHDKDNIANFNDYKKGLFPRGKKL